MDSLAGCNHCILSLSDFDRLQNLLFPGCSTKLVGFQYEIARLIKVVLTAFYVKLVSRSSCWTASWLVTIIAFDDHFS